MLSKNPHKMVWKNGKKPAGFRKTTQDRDEEGRSEVHGAEKAPIMLSSLATWVIMTESLSERVHNQKNMMSRKTRFISSITPQKWNPD